MCSKSESKSLASWNFFLPPEDLRADRDARNKFRAITKYYEESGEGFPGVAAVGAPSARSNGKRKSATVKSETENDEEESIGGKPSVKKAKTTGNGTTPKKAAAKKELEVEGVEMKKEEEEDA